MAKFERAVGKSSVTNFKLQINDSEGFLAFVETLKTNRSKACMSVPKVGARTLQLSKLMMEKAYYGRSGQMARSLKIRAAGCRFHIATYKEFISGQAEPVLSRAGKATGRFIKASRSGRFIVLSKPASIKSGRVIKARPGRNGRFITKKRPRGQISDFLLPRTSSLSASNGRFIKADGRPFCHQEAAAWPDLWIWAADGRFPIPVQAVSQRPGRAIFRKSWRSECSLYQTG